jgi:hypothetical protein
MPARDAGVDEPAAMHHPRRGIHAADVASIKPIMRAGEP